MEYNFELIGTRIRTERKRSNMSQDEFLAMLSCNYGIGMNRNTLSAIENGRYQNFTLDFLAALCQEFDCEMGYLLGEHDTKTRLAYDIGKETGLSERAVDCLHKWAIEKELPVTPYNGAHKTTKNSAIKFLNIINLLFEERNGQGESLDNSNLFDLIHKFLYSNITEITAFNQNGSLKKIKDWKFLFCKDTDNLNDEFNLHDVEKQIALNKIRDELEAIYKWLHGKS
ncbi:MAG: helix-turn-helix domain-containing protein [Hominisplanchenecus sp.]